MRWVPDRTGRFPQRPHYDPQELDAECESVIMSFLGIHRKDVSFPVTTNELTLLLERESGDVDLYADLSKEGDDVEGVTDFLPGSKPRVRIDKRLSEQAWRENRLRTTITHEFGHVKFHDFLWAAAAQQLTFLDIRESTPKCRRESMLNANQTDWMEWQAGHISGALLMPVTPLRKLVGGFLSENDLHAPIPACSVQGLSLTERVQQAFQVSQDAARVRLAKLGVVVDQVHVTANLSF